MSYLYIQKALASIFYRNLFKIIYLKIKILLIFATRVSWNSRITTDFKWAFN